MKNTILLLVLLITIPSISQTDTEVYLFDLVKENNGITINNQRNITNNEGYDNQPSFYNDSIILFSSTRKDQTDIATYSIKDSKVNWVCNTKQGSEYSPTKIPGQDHVSAIRLDTDEKQLLYHYNYKTGESEVLLKELKVGYHTWYNKDIIVSSVLENEGLSLVVSNLKDNTNNTFLKNIGRSLHKIPNSDLISYISKENDTWEIKSINPISGEIKKITNTIKGVEDMCWLSDGTILMGKGNTIFKFNPEKDSGWSLFYSFTGKEVGNITRLATNSNSTMLALVSDISPEHIVQKQLNAYNARDIDTFLATCTDDIKVYYYPNILDYEGKEKMRKSYSNFFNKTPDLNCEIKNRIVIGNKVIDEELVTINGQKFSAVAIYEVENGKIAKMTFIQ